MATFVAPVPPACSCGLRTPLRIVAIVVWPLIALGRRRRRPVAAPRERATADA